MASSIQLVLRKDKLNKKGTLPLYFRIIKNRKSTNIATGIRIEERFWDDQRKVVKTTHPNSVRMNNMLRTKETAILNSLLKTENKDLHVGVKEIKATLNGINNEDFFAVANSIVNGYYAKGKIGTYDRTKSVIAKLKKYIGKDSYAFTDIDVGFIKKYERYMVEVIGNSANTVHSNLKFIRQVFNTAVKEGLIEQRDNPFGKITLRSAKTEREYLLQNEIDAIMHLDLSDSPRLQKHRDMFIFSCYACGLRVSDVLLLKWGNISGEHINIVIQKTGVQSTIYMPKVAQNIIKRYKAKGNEENNYVFACLHEDITKADPVKLDKAITLATAKINKNLKTIAKKAGINKNLSFHVSRHSFATNALRKGIPIEHVQKLLGHANIRETLIYAKIVNADLDKSMKAFDE